MSGLVDYSRFDAIEVSDDENAKPTTAAKPTNAVFEASDTIREWRRTQEKMYDAAQRDAADDDLGEIWDDIPPHMRPPGLAPPPPRAPHATEAAPAPPPPDTPAAALPSSDAVAAAVVKARRGLRRCLDAQRQLRGDVGSAGPTPAGALEPDLFALWDPARTGSCDAKVLRGTLEGCGLTPSECELLVDALAPPIPTAAGGADANEPRQITCEDFVRVFSAHEVKT